MTKGYVENMKENLGKPHPAYGGKLVDLMTLPEDTVFTVANGCWDGCIYLNKDGAKCVVPLTADKEKYGYPITDENRYSLWLENIIYPDQCSPADARIHLDTSGSISTDNA